MSGGDGVSRAAVNPRHQPRDHTRGPRRHPLSEHDKKKIVTGQRLREIERILEFRHARSLGGNGVEVYLVSAARALGLIFELKHGRRPPATKLRELVAFWASGRFARISDATLAAIADEWAGRYGMGTADAIGAALSLPYADRLRLRVKTIGACDADKAERARRAKARKCERERNRIAAKRRADGVTPRGEFLAQSLRRRQPWAALGMSERNWYRKGRPEAGKGVLAELGRGVLAKDGGGALAHKLSSGERHNVATAAEDERPLAGLATGSLRDAADDGTAGLPKAEGRPASAPPQGAVASGPARPARVVADDNHAAPAGRHMLVVQKWGASPQQARALVDRLVEAAGPDRHAHIGELITMMEKRHSLVGRRKIEWLGQQAEKMAKCPWYRAQRKLPDAARRRNHDAFLDVLRKSATGRASIADVVRATGLKKLTVRGVAVWLLKDDLIERIKPGVFGLPGGVAKPYSSARPAVIAALAAAPGNQLTAAELVGGTGKSRSAIDAALHRLTRADKVVRVKLGVFALPADSSGRSAVSERAGFQSGARAVPR